MSSTLVFALAAVVSALFPFSIGAVALFDRIADGRIRTLVLFVWLLLGAAVLDLADAPPPAWMLAWAMLTALFYAWRALAVRDAGLWVVFLVISSAALLWAGAGREGLLLKAVALGLPLAMMGAVVTLVERHFGAAHVALDLRLASHAPKLSGLFAIGLFAVIAMPVSPSFFAMIALVVDQAQGSAPTVLAVLACWLLWSWSAARLFAGLVVGPPRKKPDDISDPLALTFGAVVVVLGMMGIFFGGVLL
jgi:NADH:ubiquinone oxidoreductase subunit 4 (subunit M)